MLMNEYIVVFCLIAVICLLVYLQYDLGVKKVSVRTALTLPIGYAVVFSLLTLIVAGVTTNSLLVLSSQLVIAYWLYWLYDWGTKHPQQVRPVPAHKRTATSLILKKQKQVIQARKNTRKSAYDLRVFFAIIHI